MKYREFWLTEDSWCPECGSESVCKGRNTHPESTKVIHVIEKAAYDKAIEALKLYADKDTYCLYDDIDWKDNWIAERIPNRLRNVGATARETLKELGEWGDE